MPRFLTGDELGNIKSLQHSSKNAANEAKTDLKILFKGTVPGRTKSIQALSITASSSSHEKLLAAAHADGFTSLMNFSPEGQLELLHEWKETRIRPDQTFVGLRAFEKSVYSCTSNGALRLTTLSDDGTHSSKLAALPTRLCSWRISDDQETFAYGGDEVELSIWNTERSFAPTEEPVVNTSTGAGKKRKRSDALFPGEIWRAKNVANDFLGLRQPVHNTALTYLSPASSTSQQILVGTGLGDVRRYDTRAGRRPVAEFQGIAKMGGVKIVEKGFAEHETFVSDQGSNLYAMDLRNGGIVYGYKGIAGAISSVASSPSFLASTALDRYSRIHSTFAPPPNVGQQQERKGAILEKVFMTSVPTIVIWDQELDSSHEDSEDDEAGIEDVWEGMPHVNDGEKVKKSKHKSANKSEA